MKLVILGWESRGLRCPDADIDLRLDDRSPYAVTLLQMPNGTGKTTTLNLIRAALDGSAKNWDAKKVRTFRRANSTETDGSFVLRLAVDGELLTFTLRLRFEAGTAQYTTQYGSHNVPFHDPPNSVARFLRTEFVQLFIFDGEYADKLFDPRSAEAQKAVKSLFQLHLFEDLQAAADKHLSNVLKAVGTRKKSSAAVKQFQKDRDAALKRHGDLVARREQAIEKREEAGRRHDELEKETAELTKRTEDLEKEKESTAKALVTSTKEADEALKGLLLELRNPMAIHPSFEKGLRGLVDGLERLRLPADTASQWFEELADESNDDCVCGRRLGSKERQHIRTLKDAYLGTEVHAVLNTIKGEVTTALQERDAQAGSGSDELRSALDRARDTDTKKRQLATKHDLAIKNLAERGTDEEKAIYEEMIERRREIKQLDSAIERLDSPDGPNSIRAAHEDLSRREKELSQATQTATLNAKIKHLKAILNEAKQNADTQLRSSVKDSCNARLQTVLKNDPLQIASIERSLQLEGQEKASVGQTMAVGYTFLVTLLRDGNHSFPLVVDSPVGALDNSVRTEVAKLIPEMSDQFLAFTISSERDTFVPSLAHCVEKERGEQVQFLTLVRKTEGTTALLAGAKEAETTETENAALIRGREFFDAFDLAEGEAE